MFRAYYGAAGCGPVHPLEKHRWPFKEFVHLGRSPAYGGDASQTEAQPYWRIDGDDGTQLNQSEIAVGVPLPQGCAEMQGNSLDLLARISIR